MIVDARQLGSGYQWNFDDPATYPTDTAGANRPSHYVKYFEGKQTEARKLNMVEEEFVDYKSGVAYFCDGYDEPCLKKKSQVEK